MIAFKNIEVGKCFLFQNEPNLKTTDSDGWDGVNNAFSFLMGISVCLDPEWEVKPITYMMLMRQFAKTILKRVI